LLVAAGRDNLPSTVANLLVYIERAGGEPTGPSLEALGAGRRVASCLGGTLYALLPSDGQEGDREAVAQLARHGADKVVVVGRVDASLPTLHVTHGHLLTAALAAVPSALLILPATPGGHDLAPRVAARLGAAYFAEPTLELGGPGELILTRRVYGGRYQRRLSTNELERPLVVTIGAGAGGLRRGSGVAEMLQVQAEEARSPISEVSAVTEADGALETARVVVTAGAGVEPSAYALLRELAEVLGGQLAVTSGAARRGLGSSERAVGAGARRVAPRLYLACGASGSPEHLAGVAAGARIVAVNRDRAAPIFHAAAYGMVGDVAEVAAGLLAAARRREATA
jgi:electron transfer flavoprotein alpha subunit